MFKRVAFLCAGVVVFATLGTNGANGQKKDSFHHTARAPKINYDSLMSAATPLGQSQAGQTLVADCIAAYGGAERLGVLKDYQLVYEFSSQFSPRPYDVVKTFRKDRCYRLEKRGEVRMICGDKSWYMDKDTLAALSMGRYRRDLFSYLSLAMPIAIETEHFDDIRYGERPDDPLGYIYLDKADSLLVIVGIDRDNHMIRTTEGVVRLNDTNLIYVNRFDKYEKHGGFLFPGKMTTISMGVKVGDGRLREVKVNAGLGVDYFQP